MADRDTTFASSKEDELNPPDVGELPQDEEPAAHASNVNVDSSPDSDKDEMSAIVLPPISWEDDLKSFVEPIESPASDLVKALEILKGHMATIKTVDFVQDKLKTKVDESCFTLPAFYVYRTSHLCTMLQNMKREHFVELLRPISNTITPRQEDLRHLVWYVDKLDTDLIVYKSAASESDVPLTILKGICEEAKSNGYMHSTAVRQAKAAIDNYQSCLKREVDKLLSLYRRRVWRRAISPPSTPSALIPSRKRTSKVASFFDIPKLLPKKPRRPYGSN